MSDEPREPLDHQPDEPGWWLHSDGRWYPPEQEPTEPVPVVPAEDPTAVLPAVRAAEPARSASRQHRRPAWTTIAVSVVVVLFIAGIAFAVVASNNSTSDSPAKPVGATTTTRAASTTATPSTAPVTAPAPTTVPTPATAPVTRPPATKPPATKPPPAKKPPPATKPPVTQPPPTTVPVSTPTT